jgi:DNA replicative helicase MCM subunit Mcm2 (Cdc46/Mcm family)
MAFDGDADGVRLSMKRKFADYLTDRETLYKQDVLNCFGDALDAAKAKPRLAVSVDDLRRYDADLYQRLMRGPVEALPALESAVRDYAATLATSNPKLGLAATTPAELFVGLQGEFGALAVSPRGLTSERLGRMVCAALGLAVVCWKEQVEHI